MKSFILSLILLNVIMAQAQNRQTKHYEEVQLHQFYVIGIAVRTTNQNGQSQKDIGELWSKFYSQGILEKIPNRVSNDIYSIYTDYESDQNAPYTTIIGCKVNATDKVPEGMVLKEILATKYQVYTSIGKIPDAVLSTWINIWQNPINRKYAADFDIYDEKANNPADAVVKTYLSVK